MTSTLLPMWRSPTASVASPASYSGRTWDNDSTASASPSRYLSQTTSRSMQCRNFLAQIQRIRIRERSHGLRSSVFAVDVQLIDSVSSSSVARQTTSDQSTYSVDKSFRDFEQLRREIFDCIDRCLCRLQRSHKKVSRNTATWALQGGCPCEQIRRTLLDHRWPGRLQWHFTSHAKRQSLLESTMTSLIEVARNLPQQQPATIGSDICIGQQELLSHVTSFLIQELTMED